MANPLEGMINSENSEIPKKYLLDNSYRSTKYLTQMVLFNTYHHHLKEDHQPKSQNHSHH